MDSGPSAHMSYEESWFKDPLKQTEKMKITGGNGEKSDVSGMQNLSCTSQVDSEKSDLVLEEISLVPNLTYNLISVSKIRQLGFTVTFDSKRDGIGTCKVTDSNSNHTYMIG